MLWYIIYNGRQTGPLQKEQLASYNITPDTMVWCEGMPQWAPASQVTALADILAPEYGAPQPPYGTPQQPYYGAGYAPVSTKSKIAAGILAIFLGGLGVQYFYLGKIGAGFITILLTIVTCGAWEVITFIQGILMLCMSDAEFDYKYVNTTKTFPLF